MTLATPTTFDIFNFHPQICSSVQASGYTKPTPIQQQAIPAVLSGRDVMGLAQTGTGKTAAFVLPILQRLIGGPRGKIRAVIISPTRELAQQTHDAIEQFAKNSGLRSVTLYGGVSISPQIGKLRRGAEIVVACPGRLMDHVRQRTVDLSKVEILVLDEADHMFDVGFLPTIRDILQKLPTKRQSLLFSATMPSEVRHLANDILKNPVVVQIGDSAPNTSVNQTLFPVAPHLKTDLLIKVIQNTKNINSVLVFTRTKHRAKKVASQLEHAGYRSTSLQGNLTQAKRQSALNDFRDGKLQILVATDIASRGIDVASISHVINYDVPETVETYTHRIGRTGRATKLGDAYTLICREDMSRVRAIERVLGKKLEQRFFEDFDYYATQPNYEEPKFSDEDFSRRPSRGDKPRGEGRMNQDRASKPGQQRRRPMFSKAKKSTKKS